MIKVGFEKTGKSRYYYPEENQTKSMESLSKWLKIKNENLSDNEIKKILDEFMNNIAKHNNKEIWKTAKKYSFDIDKNDDFEEFSITITSETFIQTYTVLECFIKDENNININAEDLFNHKLNEILNNHINILNSYYSPCSSYMNDHYWKLKNPDIEPSSEQILKWKIKSLKHSLEYYIRHFLYRAAINICKEINLISKVEIDNTGNKYFCINIDDISFYFVNKAKLIYYELREEAQI